MSDVGRKVAATKNAKAKKGFVADIEELTEENSDFRHVLYTGKSLQLVLMAIQRATRSVKKPMLIATSSFGWKKARAKSGSTVFDQRSKAIPRSLFLREPGITS